MHGIVIAAFTLALSTTAFQGRVERSPSQRLGDNQFSERIRSGEDSGRRICAVDRLAESRLPRTTCRTAREWRDRQLHDLRKE